MIDVDKSVCRFDAIQSLAEIFPTHKFTEEYKNKATKNSKFNMKIWIFVIFTATLFSVGECGGSDMSIMDAIVSISNN